MDPQYSKGPIGVLSGVLWGSYWSRYPQSAPAAGLPQPR